MAVDIFDRDDGALGTPWVSTLGVPQPVIVSNKATLGVTTYEAVALFNTPTSNNQYAQVEDIVLTHNDGIWIGAAVRASTSANSMYVVLLQRLAGPSWRFILGKIINGSLTILDSTWVGDYLGNCDVDGVRITVSGSTLIADHRSRISQT